MSPVGEKDDSLQHQDETLVPLAPAVVWDSCTLWHPFQSHSSCYLYRSSLWETLQSASASQWYFTLAMKVATVRISSGGWLGKKEAKLADFSKKKRKITEITGREKKSQVWQDYKSTLPTPVHPFEAYDTTKFALYNYAKHAPLQSQNGIYSNVCYHSPLVLIFSLCSINLLCFMFQNRVKYLSWQFNIYLPKVNKRSLKTYIQYVLSF